MNPYYNQRYTKDEISSVLKTIRECIVSGRYSISMNENREKNIDFINDYNIYPKKRKQILLKITVDDFCHTLNNRRAEYEHEVLYVFVPVVELYNAFGEIERIAVYTKFNLIERENGNFTVVVSFHKLNRPIEYLFR